MKKKLVVSGATGFTGKHLVRRIMDSDLYGLILIVREKSDISIFSDIIDKTSFYRYNGDIGGLIKFLSGQGAVDAVIHLASLCLGSHNPEDVDDLVDSNIKFGTHLLEAMRAVSCVRFINTSSYWQHYNNEDYNPTSLYAATKEAFEKIIKFYAEAYDFRCITLELFDSYGESDTRGKIMNLIDVCAHTGVPLKMSAGEQNLCFTHIDDVVSAYLVALELAFKSGGKMNKKYMIRPSETVTLKELALIFEELHKKKIPIEFGALPYRKREVFAPWDKGENLAGWNAKIGLLEGIRETFIQENNSSEGGV